MDANVTFALTPEQTYQALIRNDYSQENEIVRERIAKIDWTNSVRDKVAGDAEQMIEEVRRMKSPNWMQSMLNEYQLWIRAWRYSKTKWWIKTGARIKVSPTAKWSTPRRAA